jgi:hypothetical protein
MEGDTPQPLPSPESLPPVHLPALPPMPAPPSAQYPAPGAGYPAYPPQPQYSLPMGWQPPKPGNIPLRPLNVGDMISGSIATIVRNPRTTLIPAIVVSVIQGALGIVITLGYRKFLDAPGSNDLRSVLDTASAALLSSIVAVVLAAIVTVAATADVLGNRISLREAWKQVRPRVWALLGLSIVTGVLEVLGLVLFVAPGVYLWGIWAVATPVLIMERVGIRAAMDRSAALVKGTFWRAWGIAALAMVIAGAIGFFASLVGTLLSVGSGVITADELSHSSTLPIGYLVITAVTATIVGVFTAPFASAMVALLYVDLRMRKEGLAGVLQQSAAAQKAVAAQPE